MQKEALSDMGVLVLMFNLGISLIQFNLEERKQIHNAAHAGNIKAIM
jgi:hypothetical protein